MLENFLIVTEKGPQIGQMRAITARGATLIKAEGSYTGREKRGIMCACNNKENVYDSKKL